MTEIKLGIGFVTGRKSFRKVLCSYINVWNASKKEIPSDIAVKLYLFVCYDIKYRNNSSTDFTNMPQDIVDAFERITFIGAKNRLRTIDELMRRKKFSEEEFRSVFGTGYAGMRNIVLFSAIDQHMDYLLFLDDDEYPMAVTNWHSFCLWSGQNVILSHLREIKKADYTNGYHCGYISPVPQIVFSPPLTEEVFREFIEAISNDIINWDSIKALIATGGVTYASAETLMGATKDVPAAGGGRFISGGNLCINLKNPAVSLPFFNPPGARGEDTFLSTLLTDKTVKRIPCYTFHDGFSYYEKLLEGMLPVRLEKISADNAMVRKRFMNACVGWIRYKPLFVSLTDPVHYERRMHDMETALRETLPCIQEYFQDENVETIMTEFEKYRQNVRKHEKMFSFTQKAWKNLVNSILLFS